MDILNTGQNNSITRVIRNVCIETRPIILIDDTLKIIR